MHERLEHGGQVLRLHEPVAKVRSTTALTPGTRRVREPVRRGRQRRAIPLWAADAGCEAGYKYLPHKVREYGQLLARLMPERCGYEIERKGEWVWNAPPKVGTRDR
jgi:hypothetical protein